MKLTPPGQRNKTYPHLREGRIVREAEWKGWPLVFGWHPGSASHLNPCPQGEAFWYAHHPTQRRKDGGPVDYGEMVGYPFAAPQGPPDDDVIDRLEKAAREVIDADAPVVAEPAEA